MVDLHSHTTASDGTFAPARLLEEARAKHLSVLAITDHDTFAGYDEACQALGPRDVELVCGIELSVKLCGKSVHLLGYFPQGAPETFRRTILEIQDARRDRNRRLIVRLRELGLNITLEEVQALGRGMTGRPHFARVLLNKGYVESTQEAFDRYLDEAAEGYVYRKEPLFAEGAGWIREAAGIASLAHPVRVRDDLAALMPELCSAGLNGIEAFHSDHTPADTARFLALAARHSLMVTGGSDFHGDVKPGLELGTGRDGNLKIPPDLWDKLRDYSQ
jgi:predicted metal-dependent phosphoesterase TrpH